MPPRDRQQTIHETPLVYGLRGPPLSQHVRDVSDSLNSPENNTDRIMIDLQSNLRLKEILSNPDRFPIGVELVSTRGTMTQKQTLKTRSFSADLTHSPRVDWVSITDNAGGNPHLA